MPRLFQFLALSLAFVTAPVAAQYPLPLDDGSYAEAGEYFFRDGEVMTVEITMDPVDLQWLLDNTDTLEYRSCDVRLVNSVMDETHLNVGIRPRGNSAREAKKNPWKLDFGEFVAGRKIHGVQKMNMGGDAPDPAQCRSTMAFSTFRSFGVPAARTHYVSLKINDGTQVEGLFANFEQVDDDFVDAWFGNEDGVLYKCRHKDDPANLVWRSPGDAATYAAMTPYEEKLQGGNFQPLADFIDFIKHSTEAEFEAGISGWLNVDGFLRAQAVDMIIGQWDGLWLGANNYYLYQNSTTGKYEYIPWDLDHSFGMDYWLFPVVGNFGTNFATRPYNGWGKNGFGMGGNGQPPLIDRILDIPRFDQQLQRYAREVAFDILHPDMSLPKLDGIKALIQPYAFQGSFHNGSMDNGYDPNDFNRAYDFPAKYEALTIPATWGMKPFLRKRVENVAEKFPVPPTPATVRINEMVAKNVNGPTDETGTAEDWLELYNYGDQPVDLTGMYLSDQAGNRGAWSFPAGTVLQARDYLLVWCDNDLTDGPLHADFKLSTVAEGAYLWRTDADFNTLIDSAVYALLGDDEAWARQLDGLGSFQIATPTPLATNSANGFEMQQIGRCKEGLTLATQGGPANGAVVYAAALGSGSFTYPGSPCTGITIGLDPSTAQVYSNTQAGPNGNTVLPIVLPDTYCGLVWMQAVSVDTCETSTAQLLN
jgi:hypothetical protein